MNTKTPYQQRKSSLQLVLEENADLRKQNAALFREVDRHQPELCDETRMERDLLKIRITEIEAIAEGLAIETDDLEIWWKHKEQHFAYQAKYALKGAR